MFLLKQGASLYFVPGIVVQPPGIVVQPPGIVVQKVVVFLILSYQEKMFNMEIFAFLCIGGSPQCKERHIFP